MKVQTVTPFIIEEEMNNSLAKKFVNKIEKSCKQQVARLLKMQEKEEEERGKRILHM